MSVGYHVREWIQDTKGNWSISMVGDLASGVFGDRRGNYNIGDTIAIGFALVENQIWFYTTKREHVTIYQPLFDIQPVIAPFEVFSWAEKEDANKAVTKISDVVIF